MKNQILLLFLFLASLGAYSQPTGYYNGTEGKDGDELKAALNDIISGQTVYSYFTSKEIFKLSDADPNNPNNVICVYSGRRRHVGRFFVAFFSISMLHAPHFYSV